MADQPTLKSIIVLLIAGLLVSSTVAGYYFLQYDQAQNNANVYLTELKSASASQPITMNLLLDFGNGTRIWYNGTVVQPGWNVYLATVAVTKGNMNDTWYPSFGEHTVNAIDGVQNNASDSWFVWTYNATSHWQLASVGADELPASAGSVYAWSYCTYNTSTYAPDCLSP